MDKATLLAVADAILEAINTHGRTTDLITGGSAVRVEVITDVLCELLNALPENKEMLTQYQILENTESGAYEKIVKIE